jgi:release factor glutamine methyltransferase
MELVHLSTAHLKSHGSESPRLDAELLVAHGIGCRRLDLYLDFEKPLGDEEIDRVRELVRRRATGEPVAYITSEKEFYGRAFRVTRDTLIPRPETELLVELAVAWAKNNESRSLTILDLGTGSGCVGITLAAELAGADVVVTDVSERGLEVARENAQRHGVIERMTFSIGNWWEAVDVNRQVDMVVSNPPYVTSAEMESLPRDVGEFEPKSALEAGPDGMDAYLEIANGLQVRNPGFVALEIDPRRSADVLNLMQTALPGRDVAVRQDLTGRDRVLLVT